MDKGNKNMLLRWTSLFVANLGLLCTGVSASTTSTTRYGTIASAPPSALASVTEDSSMVTNDRVETTVGATQCQRVFALPQKLWSGMPSEIVACRNLCNMIRAMCGISSNCKYQPSRSDQICQQRCSCGGFGFPGCLLSCKPVLQQNETTLKYSTTTKRPGTTAEQRNITTESNCTIINPSREPQQCLYKTCVHGVCEKEHFPDGSVSAKCHCDPGWMFPTCERCCSKPCVHGRCDFSEDNKMVCLCQHNYTGEFCNEPKAMTGPVVIGVKESVVIAVCLGILCITLVVSGLIVYLLWKRRVYIIMKIIYKFQKIEEDDDRIYDAFISYKNRTEDDDFVHKQLYPKLEKHYKFKLCLHHRDFEPGETIANNIIRAVENSRRTILILSPDYVRSEWPQMEYQVAQQEMLKRKHRIIPIMYKDINGIENIDENLKFILKTVTYIEWPNSEFSDKEDRFWEKLRLSMPKKRKSGVQQSCTTTTFSSVVADDLSLGYTPDSTKSNTSLTNPAQQEYAVSHIPSQNNSEVCVPSVKSLSNAEDDQRSEVVEKNMINAKLNSALNGKVSNIKDDIYMYTSTSWI